MSEKKQFSKEEAVSFFKSGIWKEWDAYKIVDFQLSQEFLCFDFDYYSECMEKVLNREVKTHEYSSPNKLKEEFLLKRIFFKQKK